MDHRWRQNVRDQASTLGRKLVSVNDIIKRSVVGKEDMEDESDQVLTKKWKSSEFS